jgi:hypothetical protein
MSLSSQVAAAMHAGQSLTIALSGGGTLVLNGATLAFAVLGPIGLGGADTARMSGVSAATTPGVR